MNYTIGDCGRNLRQQILSGNPKIWVAHLREALGMSIIKCSTTHNAPGNTFKRQQDVRHMDDGNLWTPTWQQRLKAST